MLVMDWVGWVVVGFFAGLLSGWVVSDRTARGCLPNIVVGILGAIIGGWIVRQLGYDQVTGFIGAVVVSFVGAIVVRLILKALEGDRRG
jgi:uncharacterized membrane protein YeaQ/YmgE (transglycosylase-associated protein family)